MDGGGGRGWEGRGGELSSVGERTENRRGAEGGGGGGRSLVGKGEAWEGGEERRHQNGAGEKRGVD